MSYADEVLADNPEWYFRFEEPSGAFVDSSGFGRTITETGTVTRSLTSPLAEAGLAIATTTAQWLTINYSTAGANATAETIEGWFRTSSTGLVYIEQNRGTSAGNVGVCLQLAIGSTGFGAAAGQVTAFFNASSFWCGAHTGVTVNDGAWHHIVATWQGTSGVALNSSQLAVYIDGVSVALAADSNTGTRTAPIQGVGNMELFHDPNITRTAQLDADEMAFYLTRLSPTRVAAHYAASLVPPLPVADFTANPVSGDAPLTVAFTDTSDGGEGTITGWLWDFGDGGSSTSQNPSHIYELAGSYNVTLTVTNSLAQEDSVTKTAFVIVGEVFEPPPPSNAIIEIYASTPGGPRWGVALWGVDTWGSAGWQNVTPQSIDATVKWGSSSPERGILTETEAASWLINTYDPERLLDPGNAEGPYYTDLQRANLPVRIRHRGTIVRQGIAERIVYFHKDQQGGMRVTDNLSLMATTPVPEDSVLSDTLRARARDAISAAGLTLTVETDPPSGDPALAPRIEGDRSVWRHIADAAQQTLHIAYVDRIGTVRFRPWAEPYDRGRGVDDTMLVDLGAEISTAGLYSVIRATELDVDGGDVIERKLTPTPRWGERTYLRSEQTIDPDAWADAVLADRGLMATQWIPGDIYPLTADDVEYFATLEAIERFVITNASSDPTVNVSGIIVGGSFTVVSKRDDEAIWSFSLEVAQTADIPLYGTDDPLTFVSSSAGDEYVYAS